MKPAIVVEGSRAEYPRDQWYVGAFSREVVEGAPFGRTLLDEPVVFYRDKQGQVVALFDRCPHRGMPLSMGRVLPSGRLQCIYHGFEFEADGRCAFMPTQEDVPSMVAVRQYPTVEKWQWIWIWMGDPAKADPSLIPDHHYLGLGNPEWFAADSVHLPVAANYLLPLENLSDATHISYLHHGLIDDGNVARHPYRLEQEGEHVRVIREFMNEPQGEMITAQNGLAPGARFNRTLLLESWPPSLVNVSITFVLSEKPDEKPRKTHLIIAVTPETMTSTHQFVASAGTFDRPVPREMRDAGIRNLLSEDVVALEAIQRLADRLPVELQPEYSQRGDEPAFRVRRVIRQKIEQERVALAAE